MRILITGAEGFVGGALASELSGHDVIASDRLDCDLAIPYNAEKLIKRTRPDYVVHLAARYGRLLCRDEPHRAVADNTASTTEIAATCAAEDIPLLYSSSSEVYGDHGTETITEDSELRTPTTIYGLSKRWGEEVIHLYGARACIVRMNMLYGPGQIGGYGRCSLATFIRNAVEGKPFTVHASTSRSWLYITDAARALRMLIEEGHTGTFNLSNPAKPWSMDGVARTVVREIEGAEFTVADVPENQIRHKNYDCSKLCETISWEPEVKLRDGIHRTAQWARERAATKEAA